MNLRVKSLSGLFALACGVLFLVALWPACGCAPTEYQEVGLATIPENLRVNAVRGDHAIRPERAWAFWVGGRREGKGADGYLIRGRVPGSWWDRDIKVYVPRNSTDEGPIELQPID